jgi:hypothetical protein
MRYEQHSSDFYVRIPISALASVQLRHLMSEKDSSIAIPPGFPAGTVVTGITEWVGSWHDKTVSVGWDWGVVGGVVVVLSQDEIRTNIQLIAQDESPVPREKAQLYLFHWIETLSWREAAVKDLLRPP